MSYMSMRSVSRNIADCLLKEDGQISIRKLKAKCVTAQPNPVSWTWVIEFYLPSLSYLEYDAILDAYVFKTKKNVDEVLE